MDKPLSRRSILGLGALALGTVVPGVVSTVARAQALAPTARQDKLAVIRPGEDWYDTRGIPMDAHAGGMYFESGVYYWVGPAQNAGWGFHGIHLYSSPDLEQWTFIDTILKPSEELPAWLEVARPKILWNALTQTYVMWFKRKNYSVESNDVHHAVASSGSLSGPWTYYSDYYPRGYNTADSYLWHNEDGRAYLVASSPQRLGGPYERRIVIFQLTDDYLGIADRDPIWIGPEDGREAPVLLQRDETYYLITSGTSGWAPNQAKYRTSESLRGPWSDLQDFGDSPTTFDSQADFIIPVRGTEVTTYVYAGTRHVHPEHRESRYVWLPIQWDGGRPTIEWYPSWTIDMRTGRWSA